MATLVSADFTAIKESIRNDATAWAAFKAFVLTKAQFYALFQGIENWLVGGFLTRPATSLKAAIDTAVSPATLTSAQARVLVRFWIMWRFGKDV